MGPFNGSLLLFCLSRRSHYSKIMFAVFVYLSLLFGCNGLGRGLVEFMCSD